MSRRGWVFTIILLGMALVAFLILRFNKEEADLSASSEKHAREHGDSATTNAADSESAKPFTQKSPSSISETTSASSAPSSGRGRGAMTGREVPGKKTYNTQGAQTFDDVAFAGTQWKVWSGVTAIPKSNGKPAANFLGEVNGYYLIQDGLNSSSEAFDPVRPMVVLLQNGTNTAGVVTGTFSVVLEDGASAEFLNQSPQIKVLASFPNIQTFYVTSSETPFSLKAFRDALKDAPEVKDVDMEILDRQYEKF